MLCWLSPNHRCGNLFFRWSRRHLSILLLIHWPYHNSDLKSHQASITCCRHIMQPRIVFAQIPASLSMLRPLGEVAIDQHKTQCHLWSVKGALKGYAAQQANFLRLDGSDIINRASISTQSRVNISIYEYIKLFNEAMCTAVSECERRDKWQW